MSDLGKSGDKARQRQAQRHTSRADMGKHNAHGPSIQHPLHEPIAALIWHPDKRGDACQQAGRAQLARIIDR
jgi:hypothetical protein